MRSGVSSIKNKTVAHRKASRSWRWYRYAMFIVALFFVGVQIYDTIVISIHLTLKKFSPTQYEAPHAFIIIPMFSIIQSVLLILVSHAKRSKPISNPTDWKLWLGIISTSVHFIAIVVFVGIVLIFEFRECGTIICGISGFFEILAGFGFVLILIELITDVVVFFMLISMKKLTSQVHTRVDESIREKMMERQSYDLAIREVYSEDDEDTVVGALTEL